MFKLPAPTTFPEGQRSLALALASAAGVFCGLCLVGLVLILWLGGWTVDTQAQRITVLAVAMVGLITGMIAVVLGLLVGGPVGRFSGSVGKDGASFEVKDDDANSAAE